MSERCDGWVLGKGWSFVKELRLVGFLLLYRRIYTINIK